MPTLTQEDGTVVAGANTYVVIADVLTYADNHYDVGDPFTSADINTQMRAIILAGEYLRNEARYLYRGTRHDVNQRMAWPRDLASEYRGPTIPSGTIPWRMKDAQCDLAIRIVGLIAPTNLQPDLDRGGMIQSDKVGPIETTYMKGALTETMLQTVHGILAPILRERITDISPFVVAPKDYDPYVGGEFDYGGTTAILPNSLIQGDPNQP